MSEHDSNTQANGTDQTPDGGASQQPGDQASQQSLSQQPVGQGGQPNAGQQAGDQQQESQPFRSFKDQAELDEFMQDRVQRAKRSALNEQAKALGYKNWSHMKALLQVINEDDENGDDGEADGEPDAAGQQASQQPGTGANEAERLRLAIKVAGELNLPPQLVDRLQGSTEDEMKADAENLLQLVRSNQPRGPGIPPAPRQGQPATFTRAQLQDAKFVREHKDEIMQAAREGRIVES